MSKHSHVALRNGIMECLLPLEHVLETIPTTRELRSDAIRIAEKHLAYAIAELRDGSSGWRGAPNTGVSTMCCRERRMCSAS